MTNTVRNSDCWCSVINPNGAVVFECEHMGNNQNEFVWQGQDSPVAQVIMFAKVLCVALECNGAVVGWFAPEFEAWVASQN